MHGDFGRTKPSLRDLLDVETDIVGLDVMGVKMEWPPATSTDVDKERNLKVYFFGEN